MNQAFFEQTFLNNTYAAYTWLAGISLFAFIFKRYLSKLISKGLYYFLRKYSSEVKGEQFTAFVLQPLERLVILGGFYFAINQLDYPMDLLLFKKGKMTIGILIDRLFQFGILITFLWLLYRIIDFVALVLEYKASLTKSKTDDQLVPFIKESSKLLVAIFGFFIVLGAVFKVNVASLIAGLGIGGLALALAAKESLENLLASITIFLDKPFVVGDLVHIEDVEGQIEKVGFRSTWIRTLNTSIVAFPNRKMVDGKLENLSLRTHRRIKFKLRLPYDTPIIKLQTIRAEIQTYIDQHDSTNHEGVIIFEDYGESSFELMVLYYVKMMEYEKHLRTKEEINFSIIDIVHKNDGIIAFPTQIMHIRNETTPSALAENKPLI